MMREQGLRVLALNFVSPFCTCGSRKEGGCRLAAGVARELGVELRMLPKGMEYLRLVEKPRFGYGRGMNPCLDCRIFMLRKAAEVMREEGAVAVVTGEVLDQRPMSQHREALDLIERESGLSGRLIRPLSAHLLPETVPEREGVVDRSRLLAFRGRTRRPQLALASAWGLETVGCPSGGCLLTDPVIARRLKDLFFHCPDWNEHDVRLTTRGRHFRLHAGLKVILGRDEDENRRLETDPSGLPAAWIADYPGPVALVRGKADAVDRQTIGRLLLRFAPKAAEREVKVLWREEGTVQSFRVAGRAGEEEVRSWVR